MPTLSYPQFSKISFISSSFIPQPDTHIFSKFSLTVSTCASPAIKLLKHELSFPQSPWPLSPEWKKFNVCMLELAMESGKEATEGMCRMQKMKTKSVALLKAARRAMVWGWEILKL
ncbi:unnamed protein product [Moneuplotes crassus]|uniref:Uncharacterized protein n=1 Tax=Euplotes crassus TaxID=5936 RepID=A0AAD1UU54_EUPCR|nr:unnamed protein product [Moneuplotes crassus]